MLTRLKVHGFKNMSNVDVRFGPFTCVFGPNGVGKSNLFDAIAFLSALASRSLVEAAASIRGSEGRVGDVRALFRDVAGARATEMTFEAEMIIPKAGDDDLGSEAKASMTFLRYRLTLKLRGEASGVGPLEVVHESMEHINKSTAREDLRFDHSPAWRDDVIIGRRTVPYIDTQDEGGKRFVYIRADSVGGRGGGGPRKLLASNMPRTVLSTANDAAEHRTLVLARREMMGWVQFQLEPSALRAPDPFGAPRRIGNNGAHLPAALFGLGQEVLREKGGAVADVYQHVANRLAQLFENVRALRVDEDEKREIYSIVLTDLQGSEHLASSLSDGTLRFLALAILEASAHGPSVLCLEEPENGIHPDRLPAMIGLLRDIAVNVREPIGPSNPMRQVIINTHSPGVVACVPEDALIGVTTLEVTRDRRREVVVAFRGMPGTWRASDGGGESLLPVLPFLPAMSGPAPARGAPRRSERTVLEREDVRQILLFREPSPEGEP